MNEMVETSKIEDAKPLPLATVDQARSELTKMCDVMQARRAVILNYIKDNFVEGVDFGVTDDRCNKKTLMKAGAEKCALLFQCRPVWTRDDETWEMMGKKAGLVCYKCQIVQRDGTVIGEGRGAEELGNKKRDANKTIKNAEKCALVDAILYTFGLSQLFTQDLEQQANLAEGVEDDTGPTPATFTDKQTLRKQVQQYITAHAKADMELLTPDKLIVAAANHKFRKTTLDTMAEVDAVRADILAGLYDIETGVCINDQITRENTVQK